MNKRCEVCQHSHTDFSKLKELREGRGKSGFYWFNCVCNSTLVIPETEVNKKLVDIGFNKILERVGNVK